MATVLTYEFSKDLPSEDEFALLSKVKCEYLCYRIDDFGRGPFVEGVIVFANRTSMDVVGRKLPGFTIGSSAAAMSLTLDHLRRGQFEERGQRPKSYGKICLYPWCLRDDPPKKRKRAPIQTTVCTQRQLDFYYSHENRNGRILPK